MKYVINRGKIVKAREFALARIKQSNTLYRYRGEVKEDKIIEDIVVGVYGEWGAYKFLTDNGVKVSKPDLNIYEVRRKNFNADLKSDDALYHVKSQTKESVKKYGHSWLLQRSDKVVKEPRDNEYFIFTCVDGVEVEIIAVIKCKDVIYGECKVPKYRYSKVAIYLDDLLTKLKGEDYEGKGL